MNRKTIIDLIRTNAFELYAQPKWTFGKNTCNTYEILAEKVHLEDGSVIPAWPILDLIAADKGLTTLFSEWFLAAAIKAAVKVGEEANAHLVLSVNLFPAYAETPGFVEFVLDLLEQTGLPAHKLQFEVNQAQDISAEAAENLNHLHDEYGIGLWLANFGTEHSNVNLLSLVNFDGLELDRSYAARVPEHEQTCRVVVAIQHMAHTLGLQLCAKGIENQDQFEFFEELDCLKGQGFLIGKPMASADMLEYLKLFARKIGE